MNLSRFTFKPCRIWLTGVAMTAICTMALNPARAHTCEITTPPAKSSAQLATENVLWGYWDTFEERFVQLKGELSAEPNPVYHLLMKRPGPPATDKPLIVFLHGFPEFSWSWENWLSLIGSTHDAIAIDLKGFGSSSKPTDLSPYQFTREVEEIDHVVTCLGYRQVIPVGHDWGGGLAWSYAILHPERVKALTVLSTPHPYTFYRELADPNSEQRQRSHYIELIRANTTQSMLTFFSDVLKEPSLFGPFYQWPRLNRLIGANMDTPAKWDAMFGFYRAMDYPPSPLIYSRTVSPLSLLIFSVRVPTLAFWGTADPYFSPQSWSGIEQFVPKLDLRPIPGAGHFINHDVPELPAQVLNFIDSVTH